MKEVREDEYFRNSRPNLAWWMRPSTAHYLAYVNSGRKNRRCYGTKVLGGLGCVIAAFFITLGVIKWWEICEAFLGK